MGGMNRGGRELGEYVNVGGRVWVTWNRKIQYTGTYHWVVAPHEILLFQFVFGLVIVMEEAEDWEVAPSSSGYTYHLPVSLLPLPLPIHTHLPPFSGLMQGLGMKCRIMSFISVDAVWRTVFFQCSVFVLDSSICCFLWLLYYYNFLELNKVTLSAHVPNVLLMHYFYASWLVVHQHHDLSFFPLYVQFSP